MADYQRLPAPPGALAPGMILRKSDGAYIPADPENADYQAFLAWEATGGVPDPPPPPDATPILAESGRALLLAQAKNHVAKGNTQQALTTILQLLGGNP